MHKELERQSVIVLFHGRFNVVAIKLNQYLNIQRKKLIKVEFFINITGPKNYKTKPKIDLNDLWYFLSLFDVIF